MRVLMLAPRAPFPADHGAALRNFYLLRWLSRQHEVSLVAFGNPADTAAMRVLQEYAREVVILSPPRWTLPERMVTLFVSLEPDLARRLWSPAFVEQVRRRLERSSFDLVQIEGLEMYGLWEGARTGRHGVGPLVVLDAHNAEYSLQDSAWRVSLRAGQWLPALYSFIQARRLRRYEQRACRAVHGVVVVSGEDEAALRALYPPLRACVVPNGVDTGRYASGPREVDGETLLFIGKMDYRPNIDAISWFTAEIWPLIRGRRPRARLLIVGRDLRPEYQRLARLDGVEIIGAVPDERPWFDRASALIVPMRMGSGVRLKVLQAMAMGVPVISTPLGVAGIGGRDGEHYLLARTAVEFADRTVRVLEEPALGAALGASARELVRSRFDWQVILPRLDDFYHELAGVSRVP
jgi:glycosyltransferase involved in cell wall biosynthesis